ncbi:hypothetical protein M3J09_008517 [Ascochyta lentis]
MPNSTTVVRRSKLRSTSFCLPSVLAVGCGVGYGGMVGAMQGYNRGYCAR